MKVLAVVLVLLVTPLAASDVQYEIEMEKESASINTSIVSDCGSNCPGFQWQLPEGAEVLSVEDGSGDIDYTVNGEILEIQGEIANQDKRTVKIQTELEKAAEEVYEGLYARTFSLPSFEEETTSGTIKNPDMVSGSVYSGFETSFAEGKAEFKGKGPGNAEINFGQGEKTEYYEFFGEKPEDADRAFQIAMGVTGIEPGFERFPVAVMPEQMYDEKFEPWSGGTYSSGLIAIRKDTENDELPVLAHETAHGLNHERLGWDQTSSAYFDEGVAEYAEFLTVKKLFNEGERDVGPRELFGGTAEYDHPDDPNRFYEVPPNGEKKDLWNYYQENDNFMKEWSPSSTSVDRSFGYAYSQLLVRYHLMENGSLTDIYEDMPEKEIDSYEEKWGFFSERMEMEPCNYSDRERFENCIEDVNSYEHSIDLADYNFESGNLDIDTVELSEQEQNRSVQKENYQESYGLIFKHLQNLFQDLIDFF